MTIEYCWTNDAESFRGRHPSREDALEEAKSLTPEERHGEIETGIVVARSALGFFPDAAELIEIAANCAYDECGDVAADWPDVPKGAEADLNLVLSAFLQSWITRHHLEPTFYTVGETQPIDTTETEKED